MDKNALNIYCLGGPHLSTEWMSIMGDKYRGHCSFEPVLVSTPEDAEVVVWDGILTPKNSRIIQELLDRLSDKVVFLISGEASTFHLDHPFVRLNSRELPTVFLSPSKTLPEEILDALQECRKKASHV